MKPLFMIILHHGHYYLLLNTSTELMPWCQQFGIERDKGVDCVTQW